MKIATMTAWLGAVRWGWPGRIGLALAALALTGWFSLVEPGSQRLHALERQAETLAARPAGAGRQAKAPTADEQLAEFYRAFPADKDFVDSITKVAAVAHQGGLSLDQGEYEVEPEMGGRLMRYQVTLPLHGDYRQIRRFLGALPETVPVVALDQVQFERQKIGDTAVSARIRLTLFMAAST